MPDPLVMVKVSKRFRAGVKGCSAHVDALRDVSLTVRRGEIVGIVGPCAAGKSTILMCAAGLLRPDAGEIARWGAVGAPAAGAAVYVSERPAYYTFLTVRESLAYYAGGGATGPREVDGRVERMLLRVRLTEHADARVAHLPLGMLRRLALAQALMGRPRLLLLDETLTGADLESRRCLHALLESVAIRGIGILIASRDTAVMRPVATRMVECRSGCLHQAVPARRRREVTIPAGTLPPGTGPAWVAEVGG